MKWSRGLPFETALKREVPSGMRPLPCVARILPQRFVLPERQNLHSRHSGVLWGGGKVRVWFLFLLMVGWRGDLGGTGRNVRAHSLKCDNIVARFHARNTLADGFNNACAFMAEDDGEGAFRVFA